MFAIEEDFKFLPLLDPQKVIEDMEGDAEAYVEIARVFLEELQPASRALDAAVQSGLDERLLAALHEIANSLAIIGASRGEHRVRALEMTLYENACALPAEESAQLARDCLNEAAAELQSWLARL